MRKYYCRAILLIVQEKIVKLHKLWVLCVICSYLSLNYVASYGSRLSMAGTGLIILFSYFAWPAGFKQLLGIPLKLKQYFIITILLVIIFFSTYNLIAFISLQNGIVFRSINIIRIDHIFFYTLNEEFIIGALLLFSVKKKNYRVNPVLISIITAALFSILHYIMYRWIFEVHAVITAFTLITLFVIGVLRNNLILKTGHIGYSWALHFIWIKIMLGYFFYKQATRYILSEVDRFNLFIGNGLILTIVFIFALLSTLWLLSQVRSRNPVSDQEN